MTIPIIKIPLIIKQLNNNHNNHNHNNKHLLHQEKALGLPMEDEDVVVHVIVKTHLLPTILRILKVLQIQVQAETNNHFHKDKQQEQQQIIIIQDKHPTIIVVLQLITIITMCLLIEDQRHLIMQDLINNDYVKLRSMKNLISSKRNYDYKLNYVIK